MTPDQENWLALSLVQGLGPRSLQGLLAAFGTAEALLAAPADEIGRVVPGLKPGVATAIARAREADAFRMESRLVEQEGIHLITLDDSAYPRDLAQTDVPPPVLYAKGEFPILEGRHLGVVGTRNCTRYGEQVTRRLIGELATADPSIVIVSGLARGIDTVAHEQALECGLKTIAVMAGGLTRIYPPENEPLAARIMGHGGVITEFPMTAAPIAKNFPIRNRIISGLCWGLLVTEAGEKSGALITAGFALNHNREVFAVPGNIDLASYQGVNRLLQRGQAKLVREGADILEELTEFQRARARPAARKTSPPAAPFKAPAGIALEGDKGVVVAALEKGALHPDEISRLCGLPMENLLGLLLELELSGVVYQTRESTYGIA